MEKIVGIILESNEDSVQVLGHTVQDNIEINKEDMQKISDYFNQDDDKPLLEVSAFNNKLSCNISEMLTTLFRCNNIDDRKEFKKDILNLVSDTLDEIM